MTPGATARLCVSAPKFTLAFLTFSSSSFICLFWASILSSNSLILCNVQRRKILNNQNIWETKWEKTPQDFTHALGRQIPQSSCHTGLGEQVGPWAALPTDFWGLG